MRERSKPVSAPAGSAQQELRSVLVDRLEDTAGLRAQWDRLAETWRQPYATPAWTWSWWAHAAPEGALLRTVLVFEGDELVGVAPFFAQRRLGTVRYRLLGAGTSARVDLLGDPGRVPEIAAEIAGALQAAAPAPDVILFEGTPSGSPWPAALAEAWPAWRTRLVHAVSMPAPLVSLEGASYEAWLRAKSSHFRSRMRRGLRKLEERGATLRLAAADEVADDLQAFADLHYARWRKRGGSAVLRPGVERMLLAVAKEHAATGRFRVWSVDLDGRTISVQLFLAAGGEAAYWLGGFDEEAGHFHPGLAILTVLRAIEHSFEQGERRLDLGGGGQPFKYEFGSDEETLEWMTVVLPTRRAVLARLQFLPLRVRLWLAGVLPTGIKRQLSRLRAGRRSPGR